MQNPRNLAVAARARALAREVYRVTASFPHEERYGLAAQMRRAAVSIGSNIFEGCGRRGDRELLQFLHVSLGSVSELEFQTALAQDLGMARDELLSSQIDAIDHMKRSLLRLIAAVRARAGQSRSTP